MLPSFRDTTYSPSISAAMMLQPASRISRASTSSTSSFVPVSRQNTMTSNDSRSMRQSKRYSVTALYLSMSANQKDLEIEDDLARGKWTVGHTLIIVAKIPTAQKTLRDLKTKISSQSKKNFVLEKDVRYLDSRIALLIQNRMALEEVRSRQGSYMSYKSNATPSKTRSPAI